MKTRASFFLAVVAAFVSSALTATAAESRLADAAEKSDRSTLRTLLKQHADVNVPQADGMTALSLAPTGPQQTSPGQRPGLTNRNDDQP